MNKRCPHCGKLLDEDARSCNICGYKFKINIPCGPIVMRKCSKCGTGFTIHSSIPEKLCPNCRENRSKRNSSRKKNRVGKMTVCIFSVAILGIGGFFAYKALYSNTPTAQQAETAYESYEKVNSTLSDIISDPDYKNGSENDKKEKIENALNCMVEESMISNINYNEDTMIYEYVYNDGSLGGVMLEPFDESVNGITKNYADIDQSGQIKAIDNKVDFDSEKYSYSKTDMKAKVMYGLGYDYMLELLNQRSDVWTSEKLITDIDTDCTVADFAEELAGYDFIDIEEHGTLYNDTPIICTQDVVTEQNIGEYFDDVINGNIIQVTYDDDNSGNTYYCIMPSFFTSHYKNNELEGSIVFLGCCKAYINDKLVNAFKDAFVYSLMCGDSIDEALDFATDIWGENDIEWADMYLTDNEIKPEVATPKIAIGGQNKLVEVNENTSQQTPEFVEEILSWSENREPIDSGSGWMDGYLMWYGYKDKYGLEEDEMWFQDLTGDGEPELIIGGYGLMIGQGERKCFNVYEKGKDIIADGEDLYTLWTGKKEYGHKAFTLQAYKDNNGNLMFVDKRLYEFTNTDNPNGSGAYALSEFIFGKGNKNVQYSEKLNFSYNSENKKYSSFRVENDGISSNEVIKTYNNYFADKTPLKATVKTIKRLDYLKMTQEERKKALTESYYAFKYTEDKSIKPPLKDMIDSIPKDSSDKKDTDNIEKNKNPNDGKNTDVKDIYSAYLDKLSGLNQQHSVEPAYALFDINRDGTDELIYIYDTAAVASRFHVYEYDPDDGSVVSTGDSDTTWNDLFYSKTLDCLVNSYSHGCDVNANTPSGTITFLTKYSLSNGKLNSEEIYKGDALEFSENEYSYYNFYEITIEQYNGCTIDDLKSNAARNKF